MCACRLAMEHICSEVFLPGLKVNITELVLAVLVVPTYVIAIRLAYSTTVLMT